MPAILRKSILPFPNPFGKFNSIQRHDATIFSSPAKSTGLDRDSGSMINEIGERNLRKGEKEWKKRDRRARRLWNFFTNTMRATA
jgi:hypothetical protein